MKKYLFALVLLLAAGLAAYALGFARSPAPAVAYTALDGRQASTDSLKGQVVLVNFWATSCSGCVEEMPQIKAMSQHYAGKPFTTVAVAMSYDPPNYVKAFVDKNRLPFFVALDPDGRIARSFGDIQLAPTTFLIDRDGNIIKRYVGVMDFAEVRQLIDKALAS